MSQFPALIGAAVSFWEDIDEQTLAAPAASITFSGIDTLFTLFRLTPYLLKDGSSSVIVLRFNNDTAGNYDRQIVNAAAAVVSGNRGTATNLNLGVFTSLLANDSGFVPILIAKPVAGEEAQVVHALSYSTPASLEVELSGGEWDNTADLISRIDVTALTTSFAADTRILLEGGKLA